MIRAFVSVVAVFVNPLLASEGPINVDAGPTWTLAGACVAFLGIMGWAVRVIVVEGKKGVGIVYADVVRPATAAHVKLLSTLSETREADSKSLASIASSQAAIAQAQEGIRGDIETIRQSGHSSKEFV